MTYLFLYEVPEMGWSFPVEAEADTLEVANTMAKTWAKEMAKWLPQQLPADKQDLAIFDINRLRILPISNSGTA